MSDSTVVLITGANKGIGLGLAKVYLSRPNHTLIASVRSPKTDVTDLEAAPKGAGSKLLFVYIESTSTTDPAKALEDAKKAGVDHIDVLLANAGGMPDETTPLLEVGAEELVETLRVNAAGPLLLFQTFKPLLEKSKKPKFVIISSSAGSIDFMKVISSHIFPAYGAAKAALNWLAMGIHLSQEWLTTVVVHPGLFQSGPGNWVANFIGLPEAPVTIADAAAGVVKAADEATRESTGKFLSTSDGSVVPW